MVMTLSRPTYAPGHISDPSYVRILDTTLRDGEQAPGAAMTAEQKLAVARVLVKLGVDVVEAGFPASSQEETEAVTAIAKEIGNTEGEDGYVPAISAVTRCTKRDVAATWETIRHAKHPRLCTFVATSEIHMKHKLRKSKEEVVAMATDTVAFAKSLGCNDVSFAAEDACRSEREFLFLVLAAVIKAGATTIVIPDTVGYTVPSEYGRLIADIKANVAGIENAIIATHCHNDLGLATANTLAGAEAGARQLEVTVNGIGERAGNAALEEIAMAMKCRKEHMGGIYNGINTKHIITASHLVAEYSGLHVQPHKAIVGANAFSHESGIHQDGVLKFRGTYEIISPEDIGLSISNGQGIVLGKLSGRHALRSRLLKLGYDKDGKELDAIFSRFKKVAKEKKHISDADIEELVCNGNAKLHAIWSLGDLQVMHGTSGFCTVTVQIINSNGEEKISSSVGTNPVDAAYKAINSIVLAPVKLVEYMNSATEGINAVASTQVVITEDKTRAPLSEPNGDTNCRTFSGNGTGKDILISSIQAYLNALNRMLSSNSNNFSAKASLR